MRVPSRSHSTPPAARDAPLIRDRIPARARGPEAALHSARTSGARGRGAGGGTMQARGWLTATVLFAVLAPGDRAGGGHRGAVLDRLPGRDAVGDLGRLHEGRERDPPRQARHLRLAALPRRVRPGPEAAGALRLRPRRAARARRAGHLLQGRGNGAPGRHLRREGPLRASSSPTGPPRRWGSRSGCATTSRPRGGSSPTSPRSWGRGSCPRCSSRSPSPTPGSSIQNVPFHEKSTVPVVGLDLGFTFDLGEHVFVGLDTGLRYQGPPSSLDGLEGLTRDRRRRLAAGRPRSWLRSASGSSVRAPSATRRRRTRKTGPSILTNP